MKKIFRPIIINIAQFLKFKNSLSIVFIINKIIIYI